MRTFVAAARDAERHVDFAQTLAQRAARTNRVVFDVGRPELGAHPAGAQPVSGTVLVRVPGSAPSGRDLHAFLHDHLPSYMNPSSFVPLDALPLNHNGKLNIRALPDPATAAAGTPERPVVLDLASGTGDSAPISSV